MWREVFPKTRTTTDHTTKYYLLVVGAGKDILTVIMEAGGCTEIPEDNMHPDAFYVEEAQATLSHIQELGLSELAERKLQTNNANIALATPQIGCSTTKRQHGVNLIGSFSNFASQNNRVALNAATVPKKSEVTSILKRRTVDYNVAASPAVLPPDDSQSESSACSYLSTEINEERRGLFRGRNEDEDSEEDNVSDEDYMDSSQFSGSSLDLNELRHTLLCDDAKLPQQLTAGIDNVLFHYVQLDAGRGVVLCPKDQQVLSKTYTAIVDNFRRCCQVIHALFGNALRFKNMPAQDIAKSVMNKSLIAIKEHGVLFECPFLDDDKRGKVTYWVIGRLFQTPRITEMYVCYQDSVPQNLVELAFKLGLNKFN